MKLSLKIFQWCGEETCSVYLCWMCNIHKMPHKYLYDDGMINDRLDDRTGPDQSSKHEAESTMGEKMYNMRLFYEIQRCRYYLRHIILFSRKTTVDWCDIKINLVNKGLPKREMILIDDGLLEFLKNVFIWWNLYYQL